MGVILQCQFSHNIYMGLYTSSERELVIHPVKGLNTSLILKYFSLFYKNLVPLKWDILPNVTEL